MFTAAKPAPETKSITIEAKELPENWETVEYNPKIHCNLPMYACHRAKPLSQGDVLKGLAFKELKDGKIGMYFDYEIDGGGRRPRSGFAIGEALVAKASEAFKEMDISVENVGALLIGSNIMTKLRRHSYQAGVNISDMPKEVMEKLYASFVKINFLTQDESDKLKAITLKFSAIKNAPAMAADRGDEKSSFMLLKRHSNAPQGGTSSCVVYPSSEEHTDEYYAYTPCIKRFTAKP